MNRWRRIPSGLVRNAVLAAVVGIASGALAGVWSVYQLPAGGAPVAAVPTTTAVVAASPAPAREKAADAVAARSEAQPAARAAAPTSPPPAAARTTPVAVLNATSAQDVLARARALAQRPDVKALVALREHVESRAVERGEKDSAATKQQLDELDRYLADARALQLKIDAAEFRKTTAEGTPQK